MLNRKIIALALICFGLGELSTWAQSPTMPCPESAAGAKAASPAIVATYSAIQVDLQHQILFFYLLKNNGNQEFYFHNGEELIPFRRRLDRTGTIVCEQESNLRVNYPVVLPPQGRQVIMVRDLTRVDPLLQRQHLHPTSRQVRGYEARLKAYVKRHQPQLAGFLLSAPGQKIAIELPKAW